MPPVTDAPNSVVMRVSGPIVAAVGMRGAQMYEVVEVGELGLVGEVVRIVGDRATLQVYEDTTMIMPGAPVKRTGAPLSVDLGPGLITNIYDGIQRPLPAIQERSGAWIRRGEKVAAFSQEKKWPLEPVAKVGQAVTGGQPIAEVQETPLVVHRIMVPPAVVGTVTWIAPKGEYTVSEKIATIDTAAGPVARGAASAAGGRWAGRGGRPAPPRRRA